MAINSYVCLHFFILALMTTEAFGQMLKLVTDNLPLYFMQEPTEKPQKVKAYNLNSIVTQTPKAYHHVTDPKLL